MRERIIIFIAATILILLLMGCTKEKKLYLFDGCGDVARIADLYASVSKLGPFLMENGIDTQTVDTVQSCGYLFKMDDRVVLFDTIFTPRQLKEACILFYNIKDAKDSTEERVILQ